MQEGETQTLACMYTRVATQTQVKDKGVAKHTDSKDKDSTAPLSEVTADPPSAKDQNKDTGVALAPTTKAFVQQQQHVEDAHLVYLNNHTLPDVAENWIILRKPLLTLLSTYFAFTACVLIVTIGVLLDTSTGPHSWQCQRTRGKLIRGWLT